jgi:hypothetical protein
VDFQLYFIIKCTFDFNYETISTCHDVVITQHDLNSFKSTVIIPSSSLSSAHYSPLLNIGLSNCSPSRSIFGYSHPAPASRTAQMVTPPDLRASYNTFTETRSPVQNSFAPAVVGSTADMASPLPLLHANTVFYVSDFR